MIGALRVEQRGDMDAYSAGLRAWMRDDGTEEGEAAGRNFCEVLVLFRKRLIEGWNLGG